VPVKLHAKVRCARCRRLFRPERSTARFCSDTCRSLNRYHRNRAIARNDWHSPAAVVEAARSVLSKIDLDPASCPKANEIVQAARFYTPRDDGLRQPWSGRVYLNPPYGNHIEPWIARLVAEHEAGSVTEAVVLVAARTDTGWWRRLDPFPRCFVAGRLIFNGAGPANFPSATVYLGPDVARFAGVFANFGSIFVPLSPAPGSRAGPAAARSTVSGTSP
jgi:hypothetical protein